MDARIPRADIAGAIAMTPQRRLIFASIFFAVFWTAGMYVWNFWTAGMYVLSGPEGIAGTLILMAAGALAGTLWYFIMRWVMKYFSNANPRRTP